MDQKKRNIISLVFNLFIFIASFSSWVYMMIGDGSITLSSEGLGSLKYFTVLSNLYMGLISLIIAINRIIMISNNKKMPLLAEILYLSGATSVMITFLIVITILAPRDAINGGSYFTMFKGSNLFFHLIIPVLSILNFLFIEYDCNLAIKHIPFGVLPILSYGIFYISNFFCHWVSSEFGEVKTYDWYGLLGNGNFLHIILVFVGFFVGAYSLTLLLYFLNKQLKKKLTK